MLERLFFCFFNCAVLWRGIVSFVGLHNLYVNLHWNKMQPDYECFYVRSVTLSAWHKLYYLLFKDSGREYYCLHHKNTCLVFNFSVMAFTRHANFLWSCVILVKNWGESCLSTGVRSVTHYIQAAVNQILHQQNYEVLFLSAVLHE